uniref:Uncharacterized protein n=1 Tax=Arundo donax TaxID=35708 RepID=A0A0A8YCQ2_ARUDO
MESCWLWVFAIMQAGNKSTTEIIQSARNPYLTVVESRCHCPLLTLAIIGKWFPLDFR